MTKSIELAPKSADSLNNLAWLLATGEKVTAKDADRAIEFAEEACKLTENKKAECLDTLAATYACAGRFEDAVNTANKAASLAKANGKESIAGEIQGRIKLYQSGQRYHRK